MVFGVFNKRLKGYAFPSSPCIVCGNFSHCVANL